MPPPSNPMLEAFNNLQADQVDGELTNNYHSTPIGDLAKNIFDNEGTSDDVRLIITLLLGVAKQTTILAGEVSGQAETIEALTQEIHKLKEQQATPEINNRFNRIENLFQQAEGSKETRVPPNPPKNNTQTPHHRRQQTQQQHQGNNQQQQRALNAPPVITERKSYLQAAKENLMEWEEATPRKKRTQRKRNTTEPVKSLPSSQRRFYTTRTSPQAVPESDRIAAELSVSLAQMLARKKQIHPITALSVTINPKGTVSVLPHHTVLSSTYSLWFEAMTAIVNEKIGTTENPYTCFRPAPTNVDIAIHGIPLYNLKDKESLNKNFPEIVCLATGITPFTCRFLNKDDSLRNAKATSSVVITVTSEEAATIGSSIRLFSRPRKCQIMWSATPTTQCRNCYHFGHATQGCKQTNPTCPVCAKEHTKAQHTCPVPTCKGRWFEALGCCDVTKAKCINCNGGHQATSKNCPALEALIQNAKKADKTEATPLQVEAIMTDAPHTLIKPITQL